MPPRCRRVELLVLGAALLVPAAAAQEPLLVGGDDLRPGLASVYRSLTPNGGTLARVEARPAFTLGASSPHPRIAPGPFEVVWTGVIVQPEADSLRFGAFVGGAVTFTIGGTEVLRGSGDRATSWIESASRPWSPGTYRLRIEYRSLPDVPARLQLWWEGKSFTREPIPPWRFKHVLAERPETLRRDEAAERGREEAARLGCARCHAGAFPGLAEPPPGPSLADVGRRVNRGWLLEWLSDPARIRPGARMPALFTADRKGFVERWIVADFLLRAGGGERPAAPAGDHRLGRRTYVGAGCIACHPVPDLPASEQADLNRVPLHGLGDRMGAADLAAFLGNPHARYPDGRMPRVPLALDAARDVAAYLLLWSPPAKAEAPEAEPATAKEIEETARRLGVRGLDAAAAALLREKRCAQCHVGLGDAPADDVPLRNAGAGCLAGRTLPRFTLDAEARGALSSYLAVAAQERHPSPFESRRRLVERQGCLRCHGRDEERPSPLETAAGTLGGAYLQRLPFQRTPRLTNAAAKYTRDYLLAAVRDGVSGVRGPGYSFRMPAYGVEAEAIVQALGDAEGDHAAAPDPPRAEPDPTLHAAGPGLVGFEGYSCVSCHVWKGGHLADVDPGAAGPELTTATRRLRREWFDRWLEDPVRMHPGTPMPQVFRKGQAATLHSVLEGDPVRQKEAIWGYLSRGRDAPSPRPLPPLAVEVPAEGPLVAQIPVRLPDNALVESICVLTASHDLLVYDVGTLSLRGAFTGARLFRHVKGRTRTWSAAGTPVPGFAPPPAFAGPFLGYDRLSDGVRIRAGGGIETFRITGRALRHERGGRTEIVLPPAQSPPAHEPLRLADPGRPEGSLERPGYRSIAYPRPKTEGGDDRVMPGAIAVHPREGHVYIASMKTGELLVLRDPTDDGKDARFENFAGGLYQEAYSMRAESDGLYVLHRRNLTRMSDTDGDGRADRFDRIAALPHSVGEAYDYAYGLVRERGGTFVVSYAPYASTGLPGSGSLVRLPREGPPEEVAFGFRNPVGWCAGPEGEVFFTDNQGEWVATNKLCHVVAGRFYDFPNPAQRRHAERPRGKTAVWVPYAWAQSINGVTYDDTGGKFGPFAGQFFLAELMYGGAIIRAALEKVNGEYQGACFPFWGKGLLGPLVLAFDPRGRLFVGSITEPGWMSQPDRGALFRIDYTGRTPFEIRSIHARPRGFRVVFTKPVDPATARDPASWSVEHHRYEVTGAYGSPELDRTRVGVSKAAPSADARSVDLDLAAPLVAERVYMISARGVKSAKGEPPVTPVGAYTLNEIPR